MIDSAGEYRVVTYWLRVRAGDGRPVWWVFTRDYLMMGIAGMSLDDVFAAFRRNYAHHSNEPIRARRGCFKGLMSETYARFVCGGMQVEGGNW